MKFRWFWGSEETLAPTSTEATPKTPTVTVPPTPPRPPRTLVLCFDGTGDKEDKDNTNIVELRNMLLESEGQLVYYQPGIGTYIPEIPGVNEPIKIPGFTQLVSKLWEYWDQVIAWSFKYHVIVAYKWLVDTYRPGDKICIFGFSRGAYTARGLAAMLFKVGLLPKENCHKVNEAFKSFKVPKPEGWEASMDFHNNWGCMNVPIEFLGCWDTVDSVGWTDKGLPSTTHNPMVRTVRHAVALDERRAKFQPVLWDRDHEVQTGAKSKSFFEEKSRELDRTDVDEVWFSGCHCDVGGGSVLNGTKPNLAHIPLRWMIRQCFKRETGIIFLKGKLEEFHLNPDTLYHRVEDRPPPVDPEINIIQLTPRLGLIDTLKGWFKSTQKPIRISASEEEADAVDALAPNYDQLVIGSFKLMWRFVETLKLHKGKAHNERPRTLRTKAITGQPCVRVHRTVRARMQSHYEDGSLYVPKARFTDGTAIPLGAEFTGGEDKFEWVD